MLKTFTYLCLLIITYAPLKGQLSNKSPGELRLMIQQSKQDTNRILLLYELGRTYLKQVYSDRKDNIMDTAIQIFGHAMSLSDTLRLNNFRYESMLLQGEAYFERRMQAEGKARFVEVAAVYHKLNDVRREARTWLRFARKMNWIPENHNEIVRYFDKSLKLYQMANDKEREAAVQTHLAAYLFETNRFAFAEKELLYALELNEKAGNKKLAFNYLLLSSVNRYRGAFDKSLFYAIKCVDVSESTGDNSNIDYYYGELALVYDELGRTRESTQWYRKALEKRRQINAERIVIFRTAGFLIQQLVKQNKSREALALMDTLRREYPTRSESEKATVAQNMAYCLEGMKQHAEAEKYFLEMAGHYDLSVFKDEFNVIANMDIGRFYLKHQQYQKAHSYLDSALTYESANPLSDRRELFQMLFIADSALGNYQRAIKILRKYEFLNDSIFNERKSKQIEELGMKYETDKKVQSIKILEKESRLQQSKLDQASVTRRWILGVVFLMVILVGLLINYAGLKQRTNRKLQNQQKEIEKKNASLQHLLQEKEWLVREIHHRVKNNFHIVLGLLGTQSGYLKSEEAVSALTDSRHRVQAMSMIHQKLYQSENLSAINVTAYIHELVNHLRDSFNTRQSIQFNLSIDPVQLGLSHCIPIGLILNEAITNSIKYAFPDNRPGLVNISLKRTFPSHFILRISDTGIGMPESFDSLNPGTMGLRLMIGLSQDIDGTFSIISQNGTTITLDFEYDPEGFPDVKQMQLKKMDA
jgi:two-component sensor histidine kinase/ribosomal protein L18